MGRLDTALTAAIPYLCQLPERCGGTPVSQRHSVDVIVVGAGLAGLAAAIQLEAAGARVLLIEATGQVGGRTRSVPLGGETVDLGAEWFGRSHHRVMRLVRNFGLPIESSRLFARPARWQGARATRIGRFPTLPVTEELAFMRALWQAKRLARRLHPESPWNTPGAERLDCISVADWLHRSGVRGDARRFLGAFVGALVSAPVERLSMLHLLWWVRRGGGPLSMLYTSFQYHLRDGMEVMSKRMADPLRGDIILDSPVVRIEQSSSAVEVTTSHGERHIASAAIVAIACNALPAIEFQPGMPPLMGELTGVSNGPGTKVAALLPVDHRVNTRLAFGMDELAAAWRYGRRVTGFAGPPDDQLPEPILLARLASAFQTSSDVLQDATIYRWRDHPYVPGCDIAFAPGELTRLGPCLRSSHGRVHFAGAERSSWPNNMEGALESGYHAAVAAVKH